MARFNVVFMSLLAILAGIAPVHAQSPIPNDTTWVADGKVFAVASAADRVYLGGEFTHVGPQTDSWASMDAVTGEVKGVFPKVNGPVNCSAPDGKGGWFIGGEFAKVGDLRRLCLAHILPDGRVDPAWSADTNGTVHALAVAGSMVYAGGSFQTIGGQNKNRIAALNADTGAVDSAWSANPNAEVYALALAGQVLYVGGRFDHIDGQEAYSVAALDAKTGEMSVKFPRRIGGSVWELAVVGDKLFVGGQISYTKPGDLVSRSGLAALNAATGEYANIDVGADDYVYALAASGSTVYIGGEFTKLNGQARSGMGAIDATTGAITAWNPDVKGGNNIIALAVSGSTVYVGGTFSELGGQPRKNLGALDATTGAVAPWRGNANSVPFCLTVSGSTVYAGGAFSSVAMRPRARIAEIDAATGAATDWNPGANSTVKALALSGSTVYAAGAFSNIGGQARSRLAALDAVTGAATPWNPGVTGTVKALALSGSTLYIGGFFDSVGGQTRKNIAALDAVSGTVAVWSPNADNEVRTLAVSGSTIYAGGRFSTIGGQSRKVIAALDSATGAATSWNPSAMDYSYNAWVNALAVSGSTVYAAGTFAGFGGQQRYGLAALDASTGVPTVWAPNRIASYDVYALAIGNKAVYIGEESNSRFTQYDWAAPGWLTVPQYSLDFLKDTPYAVDIERGGAPTVRTLTLTNAGNKPLTFTGGATGSLGLAITGRRAADFKIAGTNPATAAPLAPGATLTVTVQFAPTATVRTLGLDAALVVTMDSPITPTLNIPLLGDAVPVRLSEFSVE